MPAGRPKKPTILKVLAGNPGKRELNDAEPQPRRAIPTPPDWLDEVARAKWDELVPELDSLDLLTIVDGPALAGFCIAWSELQKANEILETEGRTFTTDKGYVGTHPAVTQQRSALRQLREFSSLFGLDPSSRSRLRVPPKENEDPLGDFLKKKAKQ